MAELAKPLVIVRPAPQSLDRIFTAEALDALRAAYEVHVLDEEPGVEERFDALLPRAFAVVGQPDLPADRLARATELRALLNVEGNFFPNVDYATAFDRGIQVLACGPAYATAVAEYALGLALDLARGISPGGPGLPRRTGALRLGLAPPTRSCCTGATVGLVGFGNLGRALHRLLQPFRPRLKVYDPWLPGSVIAEHGATPSTLMDLLGTSEFVFVLATVTPESEHLLGAVELAHLRPGTRLILVSRAAVVDYDALLRRVAAGQLLAAVDVWPTEPVAARPSCPRAGRPGAVGAPGRRDPGRVREHRRHGGRRPAPRSPAACRRCGCRSASRELVTRYRNRPVT